MLWGSKLEKERGFSSTLSRLCPCDRLLYTQASHVPTFKTQPLDAYRYTAGGS